jgi:hypothetical protein
MPTSATYFLVVSKSNMAVKEERRTKPISNHVMNLLYFVGGQHNSTEGNRSCSLTSS